MAKLFADCETLVADVKSKRNQNGKVVRCLKRDTRVVKVGEPVEIDRFASVPLDSVFEGRPDNTLGQVYALLTSNVVIMLLKPISQGDSPFEGPFERGQGLRRGRGLAV